MSRSATKTHRWVAIFLVLIAIFLLVRVYRQHRMVDVFKEPATLSTQSEESEPIEFDFYKILPEMAVVDSAESSKTNVNQDHSAAMQYVLQAASSTQRKDAEYFRDRLQGFGYRAFIQSYQKGDTTWYRVMVGPYQTLEMAERGKEQLKEQNFNALLLKVPPSENASGIKSQIVNSQFET